MRRKSVALVMAAATVLSLMAGSGVTALADEETVELTMWGGWAGDQIGQLEKQLEGFNNSQDKIHVTYMAQDSMEQKLLTASLPMRYRISCFGTVSIQAYMPPREH